MVDDVQIFEKRWIYEKKCIFFTSKSTLNGASSHTYKILKVGLSLKLNFCIETYFKVYK